MKIKAGDKLDVKIMDKWKKFEVVSFCNDWIEFKNPNGKNFSLGIEINRNHIKFPKETIKKEIKIKKKRGRKKKNG